MASTYNTRPLAPEVLVRGDRFEVVRRRWQVDDQLALETLPDWGLSFRYGPPAPRRHLWSSGSNAAGEGAGGPWWL